MKVIIVGGVAAGTKVAAKLKREDRSNEVIILTKSKEISYAGCGWPYYVGDVIKNKEQLIVNTPEKFSKLTGAEVHNEIEVTGLDREKKIIKAKDLKTGKEVVYPYDKLVISTGARPVKPPLKGIDLPGVYFMRTPDDAVNLKADIEAGKIKRAAVIGGGYIGLEVAENLALQNIKVSVIEMAPHILTGFDKEFAEYAEDHLAEHGIMVFSGTKLESIEGTDRVEKIQTSKKTMEVDAVIMSVGIRPNTEFLADSGIELLPNKTIKVNEYLQTNDENIYAAGDCVSVKNILTDKLVWSPMGSSANIEGRILAQNLNGKKIKFKGVLGTAVAKLPELNVGRTGLTEAAAKEMGFDAVSVITVEDDKAHYYAGAANFIIKLIADRKTLKILGVQVFGKGAVDKVVDIVVTAMSMRGTLHDIEDLDLAYAPPFSTAIHPIVHTVNVLFNKINGALETITPAEYLEGKGNGYAVFDSCSVATIEGAPYLELTDINGKLEGYDLDDRLLLVCNKGKKAYLVQNRLKYYGYTNTRVLEGGVTFNKVKV